MRTAAGLSVALVGAVAICTVAEGPAEAAAPRAATKDCAETAQTTIDMRACAATQEKTSDVRLNKAYADLLRYVDGSERAQLVGAQRDWLKFRDADCEFFGGGNGSLAPVNDAYCRAQLSNDRAKELETWPPNASRDALQPIR